MEKGRYMTCNIKMYRKFKVKIKLKNEGVINNIKHQGNQYERMGVKGCGRLRFQ